MPVLLVRHKVRDYATWKVDFDAQGETRRANGSRGGRLFRNAANPNETFILFEWDGLDRARPGSAPAGLGGRTKVAAYKLC